MMNPHCKIGRVRMRDGGADVRLIQGGQGEPGAPDRDLRGRMMRNVRTLVEMFPDMAGYAVVCWGNDAAFSRATGTTAASPIRITLLPSFVAEVLRRDTITDVVREQFE